MVAQGPLFVTLLSNLEISKPTSKKPLKPLIVVVSEAGLLAAVN